jgi:hypothetical protein
VIGANWAVFGSVDRVLKNIWSELSIVSVVVSLAIGLFGAWKLGGLLRQRLVYVEADRERWTREFDENCGKETPWPFTKEIDRWGAFLRLTKTLLPVFGGIFFLLALFLTPTSPEQTRSTSNNIHAPPTQQATPLPAKR